MMKMNLPNKLTVIRIVFTPIFLALFLSDISHNYLFDLTNLNILLVGGVELPSGESISIKYNSDDIAKYYSDIFDK